MHRTVVAELLGQLVPLTAGSQAKNDTIEGVSRINALAASLAGRILGQDQLMEDLPEFVGHPPDGEQGLSFGADRRHCSLQKQRMNNDRLGTHWF